jgi:hypothetical protein
MYDPVTMGVLAESRMTPRSKTGQSCLSRVAIDETANLTSGRCFINPQESVLVVLVGGERPINELLNSPVTITLEQCT